MSKADYKPSLNDFFTHHGLRRSGLVHDAELHLSQMQVEALAASGDCFVTLASEIDGISESLTSTSAEHTRLELEKITSILLYLQQHYKVTRKTV